MAAPSNAPLDGFVAPSGRAQLLPRVKVWARISRHAKITDESVTSYLEGHIDDIP